MNAPVTSFRRIPAVPDAASPTIGMMDLAEMLGVDRRGGTSRPHTSPEYRVRYVQALIDTEHFPKPLPHLASGTRKDDDGNPIEELRTEINYRKSRWLRAPVEAWFQGIIPPHLANAIDDAELRAAAARMDAAADEIAA